MPTAAKSRTDSLDAVYESLHQLLSRYSPPFNLKSGTVKNKKDLHLTVPKPVVVPGAYGGTPKEVGLAAIILQKAYVGFYFLPIYLDPKFKKNLSPALLKLLKGKTCFYLTKLDDNLIRDIDSALKAGTKSFKDRGWI